jgi:hypothetical protein
MEGDRDQIRQILDDLAHHLHRSGLKFLRKVPPNVPVDHLNRCFQILGLQLDELGAELPKEQSEVNTKAVIFGDPQSSSISTSALEIRMRRMGRGMYPGWWRVPIDGCSLERYAGDAKSAYACGYLGPLGGTNNRLCTYAKYSGS